MSGFQPLIETVRAFVQQSKTEGNCREFIATKEVNWPPAGPKDIVLLPDLALELGHPEDASLSFILWTEEEKEINDNRITLVGPDICEAAGGRLPLGKVVLAATEPCDESTAYERYRGMDLARFNISLKGFMLRAASQYLREWSRISREAVQNHFSFHILGSALIRELQALAGVKAVEVLFVAQSKAAVNALQTTGTTAGRMIQAMNKRLNEIEADCDRCDYQDVCNRAAQMGAVHHRRLKQRNG